MCTISVAIYGFYSKVYNSFGSLLSCTVHYSTVFPELAVTVHSTSTLKIAAKSTGQDTGMVCAPYYRIWSSLRISDLQPPVCLLVVFPSDSLSLLH